jgi:hypothetical protein
MQEKKKLPYESAELELIRLEDSDVITTSSELGDGGDIDDGGWTSTSW